MQSDEELVSAALGGDRSAFPQLVRRYQERLFRFLLVRSANRADAEDALQDTFANAYRYLDSFDPRWRFSTWIYRIGLREAGRLAAPAAAVDQDIVDPHADPLRDCLRDSERENLWLTARRCLGADACTALWLRYVEELSVREVARALDRSESWAKVTLKRSRDRLAAELGDVAAAEHHGGNYG